MKAKCPLRRPESGMRVAGRPARSEDQAESAVAARSLGLAGRLGRLPYSGNESAWVAEVFCNSGMASDALLEEAATGLPGAAWCTWPATAWPTRDTAVSLPPWPLRRAPRAPAIRRRWVPQMNGG